MSQRIEIGYICDKSGGHFSLTGMSDHGACGSHKGAIIYVELNPDAFREPLDLEFQVEQMRAWIRDAEEALIQQTLAEEE